MRNKMNFFFILANGCNETKSEKCRWGLEFFLIPCRKKHMFSDSISASSICFRRRLTTTTEILLNSSD